MNHTYALPGTYTVILIVRDSVGMSAERRTAGATEMSPLA